MQVCLLLSGFVFGVLRKDSKIMSRDVKYIFSSYIFFAKNIFFCVFMFFWKGGNYYIYTYVIILNK